MKTRTMNMVAVFARMYVSIVLCWMATLPMCAQDYKVIERSQKKTPTWVGNVEENFIIATATDDDLENAKQKCLDNVKLQIAQAVAQNIEFTSENIVEQISRGQEVDATVEFRSKGTTQVGALPFISGITFAKASDSYWEKLSEKKSGKIVYAFSVRYPFAKGELYALQEEFNKRDEEMVALVTEMEQNVDEIEAVEDIDVCIAKLKPAVEYFFDNARKQWVESVVNRYKKIPSLISVEGRSGMGSEYVVSLMFKGRKIRTSAMPKMKANCASQLAAKAKGDDIVITYNDEDCLDDEENFIELTFKLPGKQLKHKFFIE
ncbi:MAG: hypothetical protein NC206_08420 [Bacteroides sp.]|nr:hypothetical protein [Roseburia sp.]MCM1347093.1 hypothetical protein [Bacteroides sp.]MCM1421614.1 hypothetical protein [Bacteroides sp.]